MSGINELIVTEGNQEAFETILHITDEHAAPVRAFVYGPHGSGKSEAIQARAHERDLLSSKEVRACHVKELVSYFNLGDFGEQFLEKIGTADALLLDGLESALEDELAEKLCNLLLRARNKEQTDTVVCSAEPLSAYEGLDVHGAVSGYAQLAVEPLDHGGKIALARKVRDRFAGDDRPVLGDEALEAVIDASDDIASLKKAIEFLLTASELGAGHEVTPDEAERLIAG